MATTTESWPAAAPCSINVTLNGFPLRGLTYAEACKFYERYRREVDVALWSDGELIRRSWGWRQS